MFRRSTSKQWGLLAKIDISGVVRLGLVRPLTVLEQLAEIEYEQDIVALVNTGSVTELDDAGVPHWAAKTIVKRRRKQPFVGLADRVYEDGSLLVGDLAALVRRAGARKC